MWIHFWPYCIFEYAENSVGQTKTTGKVEFWRTSQNQHTPECSSQITPPVINDFPKNKTTLASRLAPLTRQQLGSKDSVTSPFSWHGSSRGTARLSLPDRCGVLLAPFGSVVTSNGHRWRPPSTGCWVHTESWRTPLIYRAVTYTPPGPPSCPSGGRFGVQRSWLQQMDYGDQAVCALGN